MYNTDIGQMKELHKNEPGHPLLRNLEIVCTEFPCNVRIHAEKEQSGHDVLTRDEFRNLF